MHEIAVDPAAVACEGFLGFGAEWDCRGYDDHGLGDEDFNLIAGRLAYMRMPIVRMMMQVKWCWREGRYDWDAPHMRWVRRQLDICQKLGTTVILTDWGCEPQWLRIPGVENVADPKYAQLIGGYLDYLIRERGYSCIRYFVMVNEPNFEVRDWARWKQGIQNVAGMLERRGLNKQVKLLGPDHSNNDEWLRNSVDELAGTLGGYDVHRYANDADVRPGGLETYLREQWSYALQRDPKAKAKVFVVGEAGLNDDAEHPRGNRRINDYFYGLFMADYAVQAARAGSHAALAWMLDDNSHPRFFWGLWSNRPQGLTLRPWFYTWSLLCRYLRPGATIYRMAQPVSDLRILAAKSNRDWTFCLVNRGSEAQRVRLTVPGGGNVSLKRYLYSAESRKADGQGVPQPVATEAQDLAAGMGIECPGESVVIVTTMGD